MQRFISAATRAVESLFAPGMLGVFIYSIIVTLLSLLAFFLLASSAFIWLGTTLDSAILGALGTLGSLLITLMLFPSIMPVVVNFYDDRIATLIERKDYPHVVPKKPDFWPELVHDSRFVLVALLINVIALPFYFFPVLGQILFFVVNGYLLGREFFVTVAKRYRPVAEAAALRKRHWVDVQLAGMALVLAAVTPIVNLFAPFWGIAIMLHLYHRIEKPVDVLPPG